jgi:hypothetical protein
LLLSNLIGGLTTATSAATTPVNWQPAWPMVGHDPQRTARSAGAGPLQPHLIWTHAGMYGPPLVGPDGSVYSWQKNGLIALTTGGGHRWTAASQESFGGPPVLGSDGLLRVSGQLPVPSGIPQSAGDPHVAIFALSPRGQRGWTIRALPWATVPQSVPFSKGDAPLITTAGLLYVPFVGPVYSPGQNNGIASESVSWVEERR